MNKTSGVRVTKIFSLLLLWASAGCPLQSAPTNNAAGVESLVPAAEQGRSLVIRGDRLWRGTNGNRSPEEAIRCYRQAADLNFAPAQGRLGVIYALGDGVPKDVEKALKWLQAGDDKEEPTALLMLAILHLRGEGVEQSRLLAEILTKRAALAGNPFAENLMGELWLGYGGHKGDLNEAFTWFERAANHKVSAAQCVLGLAYMEGNGPVKDPEKGVHWLREAAAQGDEFARYFLACYFQDGIRVKKDEGRAFALFKESAEKGFLPAQARIGIHYLLGLGTPKDEVEALKWLTATATNGWPEGTTSLARLYRDGRAGLPRNADLAVKLFRDAAERGDPGAQFDLGLIYVLGNLAPKDEVEGNKWFLRAALQGVAAAQNCYGYSLAKGNGATANPVEAYKWLSLAIAQNEPRAKVNLSALINTMTPEQIDAGKRAAAAFRPKPERPVKQPTMFDAVMNSKLYAEGVFAPMPIE